MNESYQMDPYHLYQKALVSGRLSEEEEAIIASSSKYACLYACDVIKGRWSEGEHIILTSPTYTRYYAMNVIKGRWPEGEAIIATDAGGAYLYAMNVIRGRWDGEHAPLAEKTIASDRSWSYYYSRDVCDRWKMGSCTIS